VRADDPLGGLQLVVHEDDDVVVLAKRTDSVRDADHLVAVPGTPRVVDREQGGDVDTSGDGTHVRQGLRARTGADEVGPRRGGGGRDGRWNCYSDEASKDQPTMAV